MARFELFRGRTACTASDCRLALCVILGVAAVTAGGCGRDILTGHPTFEPDINVDPMTVGFGNELLGVRAVRTVTISNTGNFQLTIHSITLIENDGVEELTAVPTGDVDLMVRAGDSTEVQLTLTNRDGLQDSGRLLIASDDPDEALVEVTLVSEIKGDVALGTCVMTTPTLMEACVPDPEVIDFGTLPYDAVAEQDVVVFNKGTGNKPLRLDDVFVTNTTGNSGLFRLDFFRMVEDASAPGTFIEEEIFDFPTAPYWLSVDNGLDAPEVLIARVTFSAGLDGEPVPPENLIIESDDPLDGSHEIPFAGDIGCPPGLYDYDSQPGCEYACDLTNGGVEICDGLDNDCNGSIDDGVSPGLCLICDSTGNPAVGIDDDACGSIDWLPLVLQERHRQLRRHRRVLRPRADHHQPLRGLGGLQGPEHPRLRRHGPSGDPGAQLRHLPVCRWLRWHDAGDVCQLCRRYADHLVCRL